MAYLGPQKLKVGGKNDFQHSPNLRLVMRGAPMLVGLLVKKDSPLKSVHDIKGKRVTGEYPAHQAVWFNMYGALATGGLTWKDVKVVPVPAVNDGVDALVKGALRSLRVPWVWQRLERRTLPLACDISRTTAHRKATSDFAKPFRRCYSRIVKAGTLPAVVEYLCDRYDISSLRTNRLRINWSVMQS
jgi:hypothetical protein